jgi:hypothetical protein
VSTNKKLSINKGIELMLRRAKKPEYEKPSKGFTIKRTFSLLKRAWYFNFELRWEKK